MYSRINTKTTRYMGFNHNTERTEVTRREQRSHGENRGHTERTEVTRILLVGQHQISEKQHYMDASYNFSEEHNYVT